MKNLLRGEKKNPERWPPLAGARSSSKLSSQQALYGISWGWGFLKWPGIGGIFEADLGAILGIGGILWPNLGESSGIGRILCSEIGRILFLGPGFGLCVKSGSGFFFFLVLLPYRRDYQPFLLVVPWGKQRPWTVQTRP